MINKINIKKLPILLEAGDYHEFGYWEWLFKQLGLPLKVEELKSDWFDGGYWAIIFIKKDKKYKKMIKELKDNYDKICQEEERPTLPKDNFHYVYPDDAR